jgi:O-antigen/teichoic acid export membrane protein
VFGIIIKLLLTIVLTKQLNILGAAVAFLISEILQLLVFLIGCIHYNIKYKNSYFLILFNIMLLDIVLFLLPINIFVKLITLLGVSLIILQCFQINLLSYIKFICKNIGKKHMREGVN